MAQAFVGAGGVNRNISECYVGADGAKRFVTEVYVGVGGAPRLAWTGNKWANKVILMSFEGWGSASVTSNRRVDNATLALTHIGDAEKGTVQSAMGGENWVGGGKKCFTKGSSFGELYYDYRCDIETFAIRNFFHHGMASDNRDTQPWKKEQFQGFLWGGIWNKTNIAKMDINTAVLLDYGSVNLPGASYIAGTPNTVANSASVYYNYGAQIIRIERFVSKGLGLAVEAFSVADNPMDICVTDSSLFDIEVGNNRIVKYDLASHTQISAGGAFASINYLRLFSPKK